MYQPFDYCHFTNNIFLTARKPFGLNAVGRIGNNLPHPRPTRSPRVRSGRTSPEALTTAREAGSRGTDSPLPQKLEESLPRHPCRFEIVFNNEHINLFLFGKHNGAWVARFHVDYMIPRYTI